MIVVRNAICRHTAVMVCLGINHFAILPNGSVTEVYNSSAFIIAGFTAIAKQTRAGYFICIYPVYNIAAGNIDGILITPMLLSLMFSTGFRNSPELLTLQPLKFTVMSCFPAL